MLPTTNVTFVPGGPRRISVGVELIDDVFFEGREEFSLQLRAPQPRVLLSAATAAAVVAIVDNEGEDRYLMLVQYHHAYTPVANFL